MSINCQLQDDVHKLRSCKILSPMSERLASSACNGAAKYATAMCTWYCKQYQFLLLSEFLVEFEPQNVRACRFRSSRDLGKGTSFRGKLFKCFLQVERQVRVRLQFLISLGDLIRFRNPYLFISVSVTMKVASKSFSGQPAHLDEVILIRRWGSLRGAFTDIVCADVRRKS